MVLSAEAESACLLSGSATRAFTAPACRTSSATTRRTHSCLSLRAARPHADRDAGRVRQVQRRRERLRADADEAAAVARRHLAAPRARGVVERRRARAAPHDVVEREEGERVVVGPLILDRNRYQARLHGDDLSLSSGEFELLWVLVRFRGRVLDRDQILAALHGEDSEQTSRSIDMMVSRLRAQLGDNPRAPRWIRTIRSQGYLFSSPEAS